MKFSLIICTYMRSQPLLRLLQSVLEQTLSPDEILIIDGSTDDKTKILLNQHPIKNIRYFVVDANSRGLTKQRNFGIAQVNPKSEIVCFLDDDTILESTFFEELLKTYTLFPQALGVGGYIHNEVTWEPVNEQYQPKINEFVYDGYKRKEGSRFVLRKRLGLDSDQPPGFLPEFSHGRSISFLPPSGDIYEVAQLMGGVSSFRKTVFDTLQFSTYFEGYGLYEDADFTLRLSKIGKLYINTKAQLAHHHESSGRPNQFKYGKMVVRNGWYVWRVKYPNPSLKAKLKWHAITVLLMTIRFANAITGPKRKEALTEAVGRKIGWLSLLVKKPKEIHL